MFAYHVWQFAGSPEWNLQLGPFFFNVLTPVHHGPSGVDLFMVLSGFCLFWHIASSERVKWNWKDYAIQRARRILPAYYGAIAYTIALPIALVGFVRILGWEANPQPIPSVRQILTHVLLIHTLFKDTWDGISGAFWSMGLEAQFYAVFPAVVWAWRKAGVKAIAAVCLISLIFRLYIGTTMRSGDPIEHFLASITFIGRWIQFGAGMGAALMVRRLLERSRPQGILLGPTLIFLGLACSASAALDAISGNHLMPWRDALLALGYSTAIVGLCVTPKRLKLVFLSGPLLILGRISYSFFLIHQPTSWYLMELIRKKFGVNGVPHVLLGYTLGLAVCLVGAWIFYSVFEKPFIKRRNDEKARPSDRMELTPAGRMS